MGCGVVVVLSVMLANPAWAQKYYWTDRGAGTVNRLFGGTPQVLFDTGDGLDKPEDVTLDIAAGKMYWTDTGNHEIYVAEMDGTGSPTILYDAGDGLFVPSKIKLDIAAGKMYWTEENGFIKVGDMDGSSPPVDLYTDLDGLGFSPGRLVLDIPNGNMYWADPFSFRILMGSMDGSTAPVTLFNTGTFEEIPISLGINFNTQWMYFGLARITGNHSLYRANLDGSGTPIELYNSSDGYDTAHDLILDIPLNKMYFVATAVSPTGTKIQEASMDGIGSVVTLFDASDGLQSATGFAINPPVSAAMPAARSWGLALTALLLMVGIAVIGRRTFARNALAEIKRR